MNYTISIILLVVSFFLSVFYTNPLFADIDYLSKQNAGLSKYLEDSRGLTDVFLNKEEQYKNISMDDIEKLNKILPDNIDNVNLIIDIDNIASKYRLKIKNIDIKAEKPGEFNLGDANKSYGTAVLRFSLSAPYETFKEFMRDLENSLRLVDISSLSISAAGDTGLNEYSVELKTYWLKNTI